MNKIVFLCSHEHSGSNHLYQAMNENPRIQGFRHLSLMYKNLNELLILNDQTHKLKTRAAIYMDELLYNWQFTDKSALKVCKFVYLIRKPQPVLNSFVKYNKLAPEFAARHYLFRLRRICEMAKRTPKAVLLTFDDLSRGEGLNLIENYLELKNPINLDFKLFDSHEEENNFPISLLNTVENCYERYLFFLKNQNIFYNNK